MLATELHGHLDDLSGSLTQMIEAVNELSNTPDSAPSPNEDPMTQIAQVLSNHLESLQWIDGAVREVETKVNEVERRVKSAGGEDVLIGSSYGSTLGVSKSRGFSSRS
jgi:nuclear pore complex protein Nup62